SSRTFPRSMRATTARRCSKRPSTRAPTKNGSSAVNSCSTSTTSSTTTDARCWQKAAAASDFDSLRASAPPGEKRLSLFTNVDAKQTHDELVPFEVHLKPVETLLFRSDVVAAGTFRCPATHQLFRDSGPCSHHNFVFPPSIT